MKELFTDLYKKVLGFFQSQEKETEETKNVAVNRMKLVLMQDRTNLTPLVLERMRGELIDLLSKYVEMDKEALELNFEHEGEQMALMLSIPVVRAKDEEEIEAMIKAEEEAKIEEESEESENSDEETSEEAVEEVTEESSEEVDEESVEEDSEDEQEAEEPSSEDSDDAEGEFEPNAETEVTEKKSKKKSNKK